MIRRLACLVIAASVALPLLHRTVTAAERASPTVVELFTSQGCSACPPADALLGDLAKRPGVIALTFNVDYWDYLGWADTLAQPANSKRQRWYAERFKMRYTYTPQIVVQGVLQGAAADLAEVNAQIVQASGMRGLALRLERAEGGIRLHLPATETDGAAQVLLAAYDHRRDADVAKGENAGRRLTYTNVVRKIVPVGTWNGTAQTLDLPWDKAWGEKCVVIVQNLESGAILGAAELPW